MRFALVIAGGSGTRLWPMSRKGMPKQLIPLAGGPPGSPPGGRSLLQMAVERLEGVVDPSALYVCAAEEMRDGVRSLGRGPAAVRQPAPREERFIGEPAGRDTLAALALSAAVIRLRDPEAVIGVFPADQVIEPVEEFRLTVTEGYHLVEESDRLLLTFGITPTRPAAGYGYLELGSPLAAGGDAAARTVTRFREKPDAGTAARFLEAGPQRYLWNSGMFVWKARVFLDCVRRYKPGLADGIARIASAWNTPDRARVLAEVYAGLGKLSVDYGVMEPASTDPLVSVGALPMRLDWKDVGSWQSFAETCPTDAAGNARGPGRQVFVDSKATFAASSDPDHLVATLGCEDLLIVHTPQATLVCRRDRAEDVKKLQEMVARELGDPYV